MNSASLIGDQEPVFQRNSDEKPTDFQLFGERNSGTNFVTRLVAQNLQIRHAPVYGWKHGFPVAIGYNPSSLIFVVYRDAIDWLVSLYHKPRTMGRAASTDFSEFIRQPFVGSSSSNSVRTWRRGSAATVPDEMPPQPIQADLDPYTGLAFETPMHLRNAKLGAMLGFANRVDNVVFARYEYVRDNRNLFIDQLASAYGIEAEAEFDPIENPAQPKRTFSKRPRIKRSDISPEDLAYISKQLDLDQENQVGYRYPELV